MLAVVDLCSSYEDFTRYKNRNSSDMSECITYIYSEVEHFTAGRPTYVGDI